MRTRWCSHVFDFADFEIRFRRSYRFYLRHPLFQSVSSVNWDSTAPSKTILTTAGEAARVTRSPSTRLRLARDECRAESRQSRGPRLPGPPTLCPACFALRSKACGAAGGGQAGWRSPSTRPSASLRIPSERRESRDGRTRAAMGPCAFRQSRTVPIVALPCFRGKYCGKLLPNGEC